MHRGFWQNPLPQGNGFEDLKFISPLVGWAWSVWWNNFKTTDGGKLDSQSSNTR